MHVFGEKLAFAIRETATSDPGSHCRWFSNKRALLLVDAMIYGRPEELISRLAKFQPAILSLLAGERKCQLKDKILKMWIKIYDKYNKKITCRFASFANQSGCIPPEKFSFLLSNAVTILLTSTGHVNKMATIYSIQLIWLSDWTWNICTARQNSKKSFVHSSCIPLFEWKWYTNVDYTATQCIFDNGRVFVGERIGSSWVGFFLFSLLLLGTGVMGFSVSKEFYCRLYRGKRIGLSTQHATNDSCCRNK